MKRTTLVFWTLWAFTFLTSASAADFATGKKAYDQRDYATAAREWQAAANRGDVDAQFWLGTLYINGQGIEMDVQTGLEWQLLAAKGGNEYAQRVLRWPIKVDDMPYLTCTPYARLVLSPLDDRRPVQADSTNVNGFAVELTLHNSRPLLEPPVMSATNMSEQPKEPNIQISVYRIENGHRVDVPHQMIDWGSGSHVNGRGLDDQYVTAGVRIPVEEAERRLYVEQFLALLAAKPGQTPETVQQTRKIMLHSDRPNEPSYIDNMMPNRLGTYEIVCRYQSVKRGYWPEALEAPPVRFEYVRTMNWIEVFTRKRDTSKRE